MRREQKINLLVVLVVAAMAMLAVWPTMISRRLAELEDWQLRECLVQVGVHSSYVFDLCWRDAYSQTLPPFAEYLPPFIPALVLLWINRIAKLDLRISAEAYPKKTLQVLLFLCLLVVAYVTFTLWREVMATEVKDQHLIPQSVFYSDSIVAAGFISAVLLFHRLLGPEQIVAGQVRLAKNSLWWLALLPVMASVIMYIREL